MKTLIKHRNMNILTFSVKYFFQYQFLLIFIFYFLKEEEKIFMTFNERKGCMHILSMKYVPAMNHNGIFLYARRIILYATIISLPCVVL